MHMFCLLFPHRKSYQAKNCHETRIFKSINKSNNFTFVKVCENTNLVPILRCPKARVLKQLLLHRKQSLLINSICDHDLQTRLYDRFKSEFSPAFDKENNTTFCTSPIQNIFVSPAVSLISLNGNIPHWAVLCLKVCEFGV